jgi:hypothetical protein
MMGATSGGARAGLGTTSQTCCELGFDIVWAVLKDVLKGVSSKVATMHPIGSIPLLKVSTLNRGNNPKNVLASSHFL